MQFSKGKKNNVYLNQVSCPEVRKNHYWWMQLIIPITGMIFLIGMISSNLMSANAATTEESEPNSIIAEGAQVKLVSSDYQFTEGPAVDKDGNIYFTDQPNNKILKWSAEDGKITVFLDKAGRANGMFFDEEGNLYACADEKNELWKIDKDGNVTVLVKDFEGKLLNGPNDLWMSPSGAIYFTDPFFYRNYWTRSRSTEQAGGEQVYYLSPDRKTLKQLTTDFRRPNGIIGTPDGKTLYVADYGARQTFSYKINEDGSISDKKLFCSSGSDGMTIDNQGNIYLTGNGGVTVYNSKGERIQQIRVGRGSTTNVTFGGKDRKTLFITGGTSVYTLEMNVKGVK